MSEPLRVALLHDGGADGPVALAEALAAAGHVPEVLPVRALPDAPLRLRKIGERPGRIPGAFMALAGGRYDLAHAFTAEDAAAAIAWSRLTGRPALLTVSIPLERPQLADRRLRLALLRLGVERSAAVLAPDAAVADSVWRWLAVRPRVVEPGSAAAHEGVYRELARR